MNKKDRLIQDIGKLIQGSEDLKDASWNSASIVFDVKSNVVSNSGFSYKNNLVTPIIAESQDDPILLDSKVKEFQEEVFSEYGYNFLQLLVQIDRESGSINIEFEFDDSSRWAITPKNIREVREKIRFGN